MNGKTRNETFQSTSSYRRHVMKRLMGGLVGAGMLMGLTFPMAATPASAAPTNPVDLKAAAVPGQFLVKFKAGPDRNARAAIVTGKGGRLFNHIDTLDVETVEFPALKARPSLQGSPPVVDALQHNPNIEYVEPNYIYQADFTPHDPDLAKQYAWN